MTGYSELEMVGLTLFLFLALSVPGIWLGLYLSRREMKRSEKEVLSLQARAPSLDKAA
jgi:uncharacterized protein YneF (UPF0154 family)